MLRKRRSDLRLGLLLLWRDSWLLFRRKPGLVSERLRNFTDRASGFSSVRYELRLCWSVQRFRKRIMRFWTILLCWNESMLRKRVNLSHRVWNNFEYLHMSEWQMHECLPWRQSWNCMYLKFTMHWNTNYYIHSA